VALNAASVECWCAATPDGSAVAVRSDRRYPVILDGVWPLSDLDELAAASVLFSDLANQASNDIYQRLGYDPVEDRLQIEFQPLETIPDHATGPPSAPAPE
jgi:hypothetical protein